VVLSKLDTIRKKKETPSGRTTIAFQKEYGLNVLTISSVGNLGLEELKWTLYNMLDKK
jgi:hypothetical protein